MGNSPLEHIAREYDNEVLYDETGNPSIFVRLHRMNSAELDSTLKNRSDYNCHPAFVMQGEQKDAILLGKFKCAALPGRGTLYALPNMPPAMNASSEALLERMRAFGNLASGMTIADHGLLVLLAHKYGWTTYGNNNNNLSDHRDGENWGSNVAYEVGDRRLYRSWLYECIEEHYGAWGMLPDQYPNLWKRVRRTGAVQALAEYSLNGTGPASWYLGGNMASLCDVQGNVCEHVYGVRLVDCEIQIIGDNNNAADPQTVLSDQGVWKAIKPGSTALDYELVEPGTAGTVRYAIKDGSITLDTEKGEIGSGGCAFKDITVNKTNIPAVPQILYEFGLVPLPGTNVDGYVDIHSTGMTLTAWRGGYCKSGSRAGIACLYFEPDWTKGGQYGARMRAICD